MTPPASTKAVSGEREAIFAVALLLTKSDGATSTTSQSLSWRQGGTEAEALKAAIDFAAKEKPGFAVHNYLIASIPAVMGAKLMGDI